jgi:hypothetical protein
MLDLIGIFPARVAADFHRTGDSRENAVLRQ